jgi:G3E family GTPase
MNTPDADPRLPVSIVTGFLGSGKTTLLNRLLRHPAMEATAVIINEFGDEPIDQLLVEETDGEVIVMANGCLCCSVQDDIEGVIGRLFNRREAGSVPGFERMLIETSGLADPAPIMQMLLNQPLVMDNFRLDSVVTLVDAVHAKQQVDEHEEAFKQVVLADRLVITKTDLAPPDRVRTLEAELSRLNPGATQLTALNGDLPPAALFGASRLGSGEQARRWLEAAPRDPHAHAHTHGVVACTLGYGQPLPWRELNRWLTEFRIRYGERLLRLKGIVQLAGESAPVAVHGVHHVFHPPQPLPHLKDAGLAGTTLVVIARDVPENEIRSSWQRFVDEQARTAVS